MSKEDDAAAKDPMFDGIVAGAQEHARKQQEAAQDRIDQARGKK